MNLSTESRYACPTCGASTVQPSRTADGGTVYCLFIDKHKDKRNRIMRKVIRYGEGNTAGAVDTA